MTQTEVTTTLPRLSANTRAPGASVVTSAAGWALARRLGAQLAPGERWVPGVLELCRNVR